MEARNSSSSIVIPVYNEEDLIPEIREAIAYEFELMDISYEIIFVDDGSTDESWRIIEEQAKQFEEVKGICFSRNFGKEAAIFAGLAESEGDCCIVMDCDFQHPVNKLSEMIRKWKQGYEVVEGIKEHNKERCIHGFFSRLFYRILSNATKTQMNGTSDFKLLDRRAVDAILVMPERNTFFRAMSIWIGFKSTTVMYHVQPRKKGHSKWSTSDLTGYALSNIASFTAAPMQIVSVFGVIMLIVGFVLSTIAFFDWVTGTAVEGFTTVIIMQCFIGSITMISMGIVGFYIARIYEELKSRPRYIIARKTAMKDRDRQYYYPGRAGLWAPAGTGTTGCGMGE